MLLRHWLYGTTDDGARFMALKFAKKNTMHDQLIIDSNQIYWIIPDYCQYFLMFI